MKHITIKTSLQAKGLLQFAQSNPEAMVSVTADTPELENSAWDALRAYAHTGHPLATFTAKLPDYLSVCDGCGEVVADIDAGFSPALHAMGHDCGGTWR